MPIANARRQIRLLEDLDSLSEKALLIAIVLLCSLAFAQHPPVGYENGFQNAQRAPATEGERQDQEQPSGPGVPQESAKKKRGEFVFVPLPIASPALGTGIIPAVGYIFRLSTKDNVSPPSVIGAAGLITDNGSRAFAVFGELFMRRDTYRVTSVFFQGNLNYNLYGIGAALGNTGLTLPLKQDGAVFLGEILWHVKWKMFVGPRVLTGHSLITIRSGENSGIPIPPDASLDTRLTSLGLSVKRDTRENRFYPLGGTLFEFKSDFFAESLGSKYSFQSYRTTFNKYWSLTERQVLGYNAFLCATGGQPPFYGNCLYGTNNELRGYEAGRYLDRYMIATQLEYRLVLPWRFGVVGFGGIGGVAHRGPDLFRSSNFLPAGGAGFRFMLSKTYHVNLRADFGFGKNEHTFSMGVSEAF